MKKVLSLILSIAVVFSAVAVASVMTSAEEPDCEGHIWEYLYHSLILVEIGTRESYEVEGINFESHRCTLCGFEEPHSSLGNCECGMTGHPCFLYGHYYSVVLMNGMLVHHHGSGHQCIRLCGFVDGATDNMWETHVGGHACLNGHWQDLYCGKCEWVQPTYPGCGVCEPCLTYVYPGFDRETFTYVYDEDAEFILWDLMLPGPPGNEPEPDPDPVDTTPVDTDPIDTAPVDTDPVDDTESVSTPTVNLPPSPPDDGGGSNLGLTIILIVVSVVVLGGAAFIALKKKPDEDDDDEEALA